MSEKGIQSAETIATESNDEMRFGFGANWADYVRKHYSDERVRISSDHLLGFLKLADLKGKTFLDIGCGSGIHSLAAWKAGAERVISFDYDANSVSTTRALHEMSGRPSNWTVQQGSVLDRAFVTSLPKCDIVYSWGVLHHTGSMWEAIANAAQCIGDDGLFYIALYSKDVYVSPPYQYWLDVKRRYNRAGALRKRMMECAYAWRDSIKHELAAGRNPLEHMRRYKQSRGMSYWHDVRDWLGGYPMEFAGNKETEDYCRDELGLSLAHIRAGEGNTEFLFRRAKAGMDWDEIMAGGPRIAMAGPYEHAEGFAWRVALDATVAGDPRKLMLYEDTSPVGWPEAPQSSVAGWGRGRYRFEGGYLIFSATDNTDPNANGRTYAFRPDFA